MNRILNILAVLVLLATGCSDKDSAGITVNAAFIHGTAAENTSESGRLPMTSVYDAHNLKKTGEFEVWLELSAGTFAVTDANRDVWTLNPDGTMGRNAGESSLSETGIYRIRVDFNNMTWSKVKINSITYRPFFGERETIEGIYKGKGAWLFEGISLENPDNEIMYYRFDVDSDVPAELSYLASTKDTNDADPESYKSTYQYVRSLGKDDLEMKNDGSTAAWRFRADDTDPAEIELKLNKSQARHIHYVELIPPVPPAPPGPPAAFIGDSITERWNKSNTGHTDFFSSNSYLCYGKSGETSKQILARFEADVVANNPQCTVILCGTNDIAGNQGTTTNEDIMKNITAMADMADEAGIKVILCSVLPCAYYYWKADVQPQDRIEDLNRKIKALADSRGYAYVDYYTSMVFTYSGEDHGDRSLKKEYRADDCHPNKAGYTVMEAIVKPIIDKMIK